MMVKLRGEGSGGKWGAGYVQGLGMYCRSGGLGVRQGLERGFAAVCGLPFVCGLGRLLEYWSQPCQSLVNPHRLNNPHLRRQMLSARIMGGQEPRLPGQERHRLVRGFRRPAGSRARSPDCSGGVLSIGRWL